MGVDSGLPDFRGSTGLFKDRSVAMSYEAGPGSGALKQGGLVTGWEVPSDAWKLRQRLCP